MAVFLTGDTHGRIDFDKVRRFRKTVEEHGDCLTREDCLVVLGDFGFVWSDPPAEKDAETLEWLEACPWMTLFLDGNHENFDLLDALPVSDWHGGRIQALRPHVLHLMRGETYQIGGHSFFVVGGAHSADKAWREPHRSWWPQEVPDERERAYIARRASELDGVDYVLTHCPPTGQYRRYKERFPRFWGPSDEYTDWLEECVEGKFAYKKWFFGHLHMDLPLDEPHTTLYNEVFDLDGTGLTRFGEDMGPCTDGSRHDWKLRWTPPSKGEKEGRSDYVCPTCGKSVRLHPTDAERGQEERTEG